MPVNNIYQSILLHAHLPFVRHPEYPSFFEENWLFEAITECYLPLLSMLHRLNSKGISSKLTFTVTPTLSAMLADKLLLSRYSNRLKSLIELSELEVKNNRNIPGYEAVTLYYNAHLKNLQHLFEEEYNGNILQEFKKLEECGQIEIIGCAATHALLALIDDKNIVRAQIETGLNSHEEFFNRRPRGIWMPECAYTPAVSEVIKKSGCEYSIVDTHGIINSTPRPKYGINAPVRDCNGLILFGRDPESSKQVWSSQTGYPGDFVYREFYRDLGWDADIEYIGKYLVSETIRHDLGLKYHSITGQTSLEHKAVYNPEIARERAQEHGRHFIESRLQQAEAISEKLSSDIHLLSPYDAELFGHWWYEGPIFLESVLQTAADTHLKLITPSEYIDLDRDLQQVDAAVSSWGNNGYFETWLNGTNDWMYPLLRQAEDKMQEICRTKPVEGMTAADLSKALQQAGRELLLAQSSDWAFILTTDTTASYATQRVKQHLDNFNLICKMISKQDISPEIVERMFERNNIFPNLNYKIFIE